jgi:hypothetical protein
MTRVRKVKRARKATGVRETTIMRMRMMTIMKKVFSVVRTEMDLKEAERRP